MLRSLAIAVAVLAVALVLALFAAGRGWLGRHETPGAVTERAVPPEVVSERESVRLGAVPHAAPAKRILFGDLHVHTTFSPDAYMLSLPMLQGEGAHPPADACDFARFCSSLDFWSITDHAEGITPEHWRETVETIRRCNQVAASAEEPDVVAFLGWEWTQVGRTPAEHYGHKNVILRETDPEHVPSRPIASRGLTGRAMRPLSGLQRGALALAGGDRRYLDLMRFLAEVEGTPPCPDGVPERELPRDCLESAATPADLFSKLDDWGFEALVIPHGTTWGFYTPAGASWDKQLGRRQHDPSRQRLVEVYSGHGNSEEYRDFRAAVPDGKGGWRCPEPTEDYLPSCWRAGEIIRARCQAAGLDAKTCDERAAEARANYLAAGQAGYLTVPGATIEDWLDSGQCRDCFLPAFNYRPGNSVQYMMALTNFDDPAGPLRFRFGFIASSDNHTARPGTGYKEYDRLAMTEAAGPPTQEWRSWIAVSSGKPEPRSRPIEELGRLQIFQQMEAERQASFFLTGGLVAVHAEKRSRDAIWSALERREVYGTSGDRILLWFDLLNGPDAGEAGRRRPMGSAVAMATSPHFEVRALGAFEQLPGCPDWASDALGPERLERLCHGECYHPSNRRKRISRIEVVRIRPQARPGEPVAKLIEDPWKVIPCPEDGEGCTARFSDPEFPGARRDVLYYVRAIEEPSPAVNAGSLRCERGPDGACVRVHPCYGDYRTPPDDDCLAEAEERAWSSPIFVDWADPGRAAGNEAG